MVSVFDHSFIPFPFIHLFNYLKIYLVIYLLLVGGMAGSLL